MPHPQAVENRPVDIPNDVPSLELFEKTVFFRYTRLSRLRFGEFFSHLQEGSTRESENLNLF